jgi:predicted MFS family arabinose efflux permease
MVAVLAAPLFLAALEQTVVTTASPALAHEFTLSKSAYSWIVNIYLLASVAVLPFWGRMADKISIMNVYPAAIGVFLAGALVCGAANSAALFLAGRFIQGAGSAGITVCSYAGVAKHGSIAERPFHIGLLTAVYAASSIVGPPIGGLITETLSWRWTFYLIVPLGLASVAATRLYLRRLPTEIAAARLLTRSPEIQQAARPAAALTVDFLMAFLAGGVFLAPIVYLPLYFIESKGMSVGDAGTYLIPVTLAAVAGSIMGGKLQSKFPNSSLHVLSLVMLAQLATTLMLLGAASVRQTVLGASVLLMLGGWAVPVITARIQDASEATRLATNTSTMTLARMLGGGAAVWLVGAASILPGHLGVETRLWRSCALLLSLGVIAVGVLRGLSKRHPEHP